MKKRVLFVDDEQRVVQGLQRMLRCMCNEWNMEFAQSGPEALHMLAENPTDVVVSDMRMPGMDGARLLSEVMQRYPQTVRIILSGQCDQEGIMRSAAIAHQYLSKPCDAELLKATVIRACRLRERLADGTLKCLVSQMQSLPSLPSLYVELVTELQSPKASLARAGEIISRDLGMTAKILQLVNSAFFGLREHVSNVARAVNLLGLDTIRALVLSLHVFSQFDKTKLPEFPLNALWSHSLVVGRLAEQIAKAEGQDRKASDDALMAGMLHDCGKLVLAANLSQQYGRALAISHAQNIVLEEAERQVFGATHAEVGGYLLGLWALPDPVVEAVAFHHCPRHCPHSVFNPLAAVHVANALHHENERDNWQRNASSLLDLEYLNQLDLVERLPKWRELYSGLIQKEA